MFWNKALKMLFAVLFCIWLVYTKFTIFFDIIAKVVKFTDFKLAFLYKKVVVTQGLVLIHTACHRFAV